MSDSIKIPSVTALIANHNYGRWLPDAIRSVATQDYPAKQVCVVDDRSTDDSVAVATSLLEDHKQLKVSVDGVEYEVHNGRIGEMPVFVICNRTDKSGPAAARNLGIQLIQGVSPTDVFAVLDADDYWLPGKMAACASVLIKYQKAVVAVYTDYDNLNVETGCQIREYKEPFNHIRLQEECIVHSGCFIRTEALIEVGGFDEGLRVAEDWALWKKLAKLGVIYHIPKSLSVVRVHPNNSTNSVPQEVWQSCWNAVNKI